MADCECLPKCPFFNDRMAKMPATANIIKKQYCQGQYEQCARYMVFKHSGREAVPMDLYPTQVERAKGLIS